MQSENENTSEATISNKGNLASWLKKKGKRKVNHDAVFQQVLSSSNPINNKPAYEIPSKKKLKWVRLKKLKP